MRVTSIEREVLDAVNDAARDSYPNEFVALMRAEDGMIIELLMLPGTITGDSFATVPLHNMPIDFSVVGTVHSHPSLSNRPSRADLHLFERYGSVNIITCLPYDINSWCAYDRQGRVVQLRVA